VTHPLDCARCGIIIDPRAARRWDTTLYGWVCPDRVKQEEPDEHHHV
jgi:hypothetical protein